MTARLETDLLPLKRLRLNGPKLPRREPRCHGDELERLDAEMIAAHEKRDASYKANDPVIALNYHEQARSHLKRAKEIHAFIKRCGGFSVTQSELDALGRYVG